MWEEVDNLREQLANGKIGWAQAYNTLSTKYGAPSDFIDEQLDKETWAKPGAYENILKSRKEAQTLPEAESELTALIKAKMEENNQ
jgi:hypothetical protein